MDEQQRDWFTKNVVALFDYLEKEYNYIYLGDNVENKNNQRDTSIFCRYVCPKVGIEIVWYVPDGIIDVVMVELKQPAVFPIYRNFLPNKTEAAKAISIYDLASLLNKGDNAQLLLKDMDSSKLSVVRRRVSIISRSMPDVLQGLAFVTRNTAKEVIEGDVSVFDDVMVFHQKRMTTNFPYIKF